MCVTRRGGRRAGAGARSGWDGEPLSGRVTCQTPPAIQGKQKCLGSPLSSTPSPPTLPACHSPAAQAPAHGLASTVGLSPDLPRASPASLFQTHRMSAHAPGSSSSSSTDTLNEP